MSKHVTVYLNGKYVPIETQVLEAFTPGVFQGHGVFETMLAIGSKVFDVEEHLKRLNTSFKGACITDRIIKRVVKANGWDVARVRVLAWRQKKQAHVMVMALKYVFPSNETFKVCLMKTNRQASAKFADCKSLDYRLFADAYARARARGFDEVLLLNQKGRVFEASRGNVFILNGQTLTTPPLSSGCLNGITRRQFMKAARTMGLSVQEENVTVAMLQSAEEVFLTNSLMGIRPIKISFTFLPR